MNEDFESPSSDRHQGAFAAWCWTVAVFLVGVLVGYWMHW